MELFFGWVLLSFFVAIIGSDRKIGYWGTFFACLFLSPIIGALFALASPRAFKKSEYRKCPYCAEFVKNEAVVCKHCGRSLAGNTSIDIERFRKR